jgi:hypothetical protein
MAALRTSATSSADSSGISFTVICCSVNLCR